MGFIRQAVSMLMLRYPSRLGNLFIVNSGNVVYYLWQAISRLLPPVRNCCRWVPWYFCVGYCIPRGKACLLPQMHTHTTQ